MPFFRNCMTFSSLEFTEIVSNTQINIFFNFDLTHSASLTYDYNIRTIVFQSCLSESENPARLGNHCSPLFFPDYVK